MKNFYLVRNGEASVLKEKELNSYPFVVDAAINDDNEHYSEDWYHYESTGTEWCVALAENDEEAVALTDESHNGLVAVKNVWCEIGRRPLVENVA